VKKYILNTFLFIIVSCTVSFSAFASISNEQKQLALNILDQIQKANSTDYHLLMPHLNNEYLKEANVDERMVLLHQLALYSLMGDRFSKALGYSNELATLSAKNQNKTMQDIAELITIIAKHRYNKSAIKTELNAIKHRFNLSDNLKLRANFELAMSFTIQAFAEYRLLANLSLLNIELEKTQQLPTERFLILWRLSNIELNLDRKLPTVSALIKVAEQNKYPLHRFILLYNSINYLTKQLGELSLAQSYSNTYVTLAESLEQKDELFFALERQASILAMQGNAEESIKIIQKARNIDNIQEPHWLARLNLLEAMQQLIIGNIEEAKLLQSKAEAYYSDSGVKVPFTMERTNTYIDFIEGRNEEGIQQMERSILDLILTNAKERDQNFNVIRGLAEDELKAHLQAESHLTDFKRVSIIVGIIAIAFFILAIRQYKTQKELKLSKIRLEHIARTDGLTQLNNHQFWQECLEQEFSLLKRNPDRMSSLIMLDVDLFKQVNDHYGHLQGDKTLKHVAKILKMNTRKTDILGRYGGEEFSALLIDTDLSDAVKVSEKIREAIERSHIDHKGDSIQVTVSLGIAKYTPQLSSIQEWISQADSALYTAKDKGRNISFVYENNK